VKTKQKYNTKTEGFFSVIRRFILNLSYAGRLSNQCYVLLSLLIFIAWFLIYNVLPITTDFDMLVTIVFLILFTMISAKRFHDIGKPAYYTGWLVTPVFPFVILYLMTVKGQSQPNRYGDIPDKYIDFSKLKKYSHAVGGFFRIDIIFNKKK